jgi:glyoxylase-like metal-dependent hydrolase (beta-lactamase superfamily II)
MAGAGVRSIVPLTFGWEHIPLSISLQGGADDVRLREPVPGILLELDGGWMLLDTGFNTPVLLDEKLRRRLVHMGIEDELVGDHGDSIERAFEHVGIDPDDVAVVALSHLHYDHSGGIRWWAERAPMHVQRRELEHSLALDAPEPEALFRMDFDDHRIDWRLADGDVELAPGVTAVATYGHTIGHQSFVVDLADGGGFVFAFDAADLQVQIDDEIAPGSVATGDVEEAVESIRRLKSIAAQKGYRVIPGHDPDVWPAFTAEQGVPGPGAEDPSRFLPAIEGAPTAVGSVAGSHTGHAHG